MARGVRKIVEPEVNDNDVQPEAAAGAGETMVAMKLLRNYRPLAGYEVVSAVGASYPGVGFPHKLWAGTVVRLPEGEAKALHKAGIAARDFD
jgi:hypothetical protein